MSSRPARNRQRRQLTRAELKAYEARRAAERRRISATIAEADADAAAILNSNLAELTYEMTRDEEFAVIRSDLRRLLIIVAILMAMLVVFTIILR